MVPFCVESSLSGIERPVGSDDKMIYRRNVDIPEQWMNKRLRLNFEAIDYSATVLVNNKEVCSHTGGYDSFSCDISQLEGDSFELTLIVQDPTQTEAIPVGKQWAGQDREDVLKFIFYRSTSGIWQSVWMEPLEENSIEKVNITPLFDEASLEILVTTTSSAEDNLDIEIIEDEEVVLKTQIQANSLSTINLGDKFRAWSPECPFLYDMRISMPSSGDMVKTYFGMRKVEIRKDGNFQKIFLNNKELEFQVRQ